MKNLEPFDYLSSFGLAEISVLLLHAKYAWYLPEFFQKSQSCILTRVRFTRNYLHWKSFSYQQNKVTNPLKSQIVWLTFFYLFWFLDLATFMELSMKNTDLKADDLVIALDY